MARSAKARAADEAANQHVTRCATCRDARERDYCPTGVRLVKALDDADAEDRRS